MVKTGHVVEDFYIGNTHIRICDDYCRDKTDEDVQKILNRISDMALGPLVAAIKNTYAEPNEF